MPGCGLNSRSAEIPMSLISFPLPVSSKPPRKPAVIPDIPVIGLAQAELSRSISGHYSAHLSLGLLQAVLLIPTKLFCGIVLG